MRIKTKCLVRESECIYSNNKIIRSVDYEDKEHNVTSKRVKKLEEVVSIIKSLVEDHTQPNYDEVLASEPLYRVHTLLYMKFVGDVISDVIALEKLLETNEEEFKQSITNDGTTLDDFEKNLMVSMLVENL